MLPSSKVSIIGDPDFVRKLEEKLNKAKKAPEKLSSSDILSELHQHKSDRLVGLVSHSYPNSVLDEDTRCRLNTSEILQYNLIQKKLNPEKIALTREELEFLIEKDDKDDSEVVKPDK